MLFLFKYKISNLILNNFLGTIIASLSFFVILSNLALKDFGYLSFYFAIFRIFTSSSTVSWEKVLKKIENENKIDVNEITIIFFSILYMLFNLPISYFLLNLLGDNDLIVINYFYFYLFASVITKALINPNFNKILLYNKKNYQILISLIESFSFLILILIFLLLNKLNIETIIFSKVLSNILFIICSYIFLEFKTRCKLKFDQFIIIFISSMPLLINNFFSNLRNLTFELISLSFLGPIIYASYAIINKIYSPFLLIMKSVTRTFGLIKNINSNYEKAFSSFYVLLKFYIYFSIIFFFSSHLFISILINFDFIENLNFNLNCLIIFVIFTISFRTLIFSKLVQENKFYIMAILNIIDFFIIFSSQFIEFKLILFIFCFTNLMSIFLLFNEQNQSFNKYKLIIILLHLIVICLTTFLSYQLDLNYDNFLLFIFFILPIIFLLIFILVKKKNIFNNLKKYFLFIEK